MRIFEPTRGTGRARDRKSELAGPIVLEALEPRVLLSGDGLQSIAMPALIPEARIESSQQMVQHAELLESCDERDAFFVADRATGELPDASGEFETGLYQPVFTIFTSDGTLPKEQNAGAIKAPDGGVKITATELVETTTENFDSTNPAVATADGSMPIRVNDGEISAEESASIEIRGPPADRTDSLTTSDSSTYAASDEFVETSDGEVLQSINAPNLPGLVLVDADISSWEDQIIYLDFDGETDVTYNGPVVVEGIDIPAFSAESAGLAGEEREIIAQIVSALEQQFEGTGVLFTATKPDSGTSYSTVFIGGDGSEFREYGFFVGLAEKIDVGNQDSSDKAFVFSDNIISYKEDLDFVVTAVADLIAHEAGHLLGFAHDQKDGDGVLSQVAVPAKLEYTAEDGETLDLTLQLDGDQLQLVNNTDSSVVASQTLADTTKIVVAGAELDDKLTIDLSAPISVPIEFDGGMGGFDSLIIEGGNYQSVVYNVISPDSGTIWLDGVYLSYIGLEPIVNTGDADNIIFNLPASSDNAELIDLGGGQTRLRSTDAVPTFEQTDFTNPTGSLTINMGNGNDNLTLGQLAAGFTVTFNGDDGTDTLVGPDQANDWTLNGANSGTLNTDVVFSSVENLKGGSNADVFTVDSSGSLDGEINGGDSADTIIGPDQANNWSLSGADSGQLYCLRLSFPVFKQLEYESVLSVMLSIPASISFSFGRNSRMPA